MRDREIAYEQNVVGLEIAWRDRIEARARRAFNNHEGSDAEEAAIDAVEEMLLHSEQWQNVAATDISDIAREAVDRCTAAVGGEWVSGDIEGYDPSDPKSPGWLDRMVD